MTRMSPNQFDKLLSLVRPYLHRETKRGRRPPLHPELKLALCLSYLAHGDSRRSKSWEFRVGRSTVHKVIKDVCSAIVQALRDLYIPAPDEDTWRRIANEYFERWQFPNCVGAVDGKHIRIMAPPKSGSQFFNYKKFFSLMLLAVCDAKYRFVYVDIGQYGSLSDRSVWSTCQLGESLSQGNLNLPYPKEMPGTNVQTNHVLIGDAAFPLSPHVLRPYGYRNKRLSREEEVFNYRLSRARNTIENSFGILASRWRVLHSAICCTVENATNMITALVCLHNFIMKDEEYHPSHRRNYCPPHYVDGEDFDRNIMPGAWRMQPQQSRLWQDITRMGRNNYDVAVKAQRDVFKAYFSSEVGNSQVAWQVSRVMRPHALHCPQ